MWGACSACWGFEPGLFRPFRDAGRPGGSAAGRCVPGVPRRAVPTERGDLPVLPRCGNLRTGGAQHPACTDMRQLVQVGLVLGQYHRPARELDQRGHDPGDYVVIIRVAAGGQLGLGRRQITTRRTRRYSVRMLTCGRPRYCRIRGRVHGPGLSSSAAVWPVSRRPPSAMLIRVRLYD